MKIVIVALIILFIWNLGLQFAIRDINGRQIAYLEKEVAYLHEKIDNLPKVEKKW